METQHSGNNNLRESRHKRKLSLYQLSRETGIYQSTISLIENGHLQPDQRIIEKIVEVLGISKEELFPGNSVHEGNSESIMIERNVQG